MSYNTFTPIVFDGLILYFDSYNTKSYMGSTAIHDLTSNLSIGTFSLVGTYSDIDFDGVNLIFGAYSDLPSVTSSISTSYSLSVNGTDVPYVVTVAGDSQALFSSYIISDGGMMSISLTGGSFNEIYDVNVAYLNQTTGFDTILYQNPTGNYVTMSASCSVDFSFLSSVMIDNVDSSNAINIYNSLLSPTPMVLSLTGGGPSFVVGPTAGLSFSGFAFRRKTDNTLHPNLVLAPGANTYQYRSYIIANSGTLSLHLSGGTPEIYNINRVTDTGSGLVLYPNPTGDYVTMSLTCSHAAFPISPLYGTKLYPSIKGVDLTGAFNFYLDLLDVGRTVPIIISLTGGANHIFDISPYYAGAYTRTSLNRVYDGQQYPNFISEVNVPYDRYITWINYLESGTVSLHLNGGTPETYDVSRVYYDNSGGSGTPYFPLVVLYPNPTGNYVTMSRVCSMGKYPDPTPGVPPFHVKIPGNHAGLGIYLFGTPSGGVGTGTLSFSLSGGLTPSSLVVDDIYYDWVNDYTYIRDTANIGDPYPDHTSFQIVVPEIIGTQYSNNNGITFSKTSLSQTYSFTHVVFYNNDTVLVSYADPSNGLTYFGNEQFDMPVLEIPETSYLNNTSMTFSVVNQPESFTVSGSYFDGISRTVIYGDNPPIYGGHTEFSVVVPEIRGTTYSDHTSFTYSYHVQKNGKIISGDAIIPDGYQKISMSCWMINLNSSGGIMNYYDGDISSLGFELEIYNGDIYVAFDSSNYGVYTYGQTDRWVNIVTTYDGTQALDSDKLKLYIDGVQVVMSYAGSIPSVISIGPGIPFSVGAIAPGYGNPIRYIQGKISNIMVYNRDISSIEVLQNYKALKNKFSNV